MIAKHAPALSLTSHSTLIAISGSGNVAQYTALKVLELGGTVLSLSDSKGSIVARSPSSGITKELVEEIQNLKLAGGALASLSSSLTGGLEYVPDARPWTLLPEVHIALPCATQNEVSGAEAQHLINAGVRIVAEGSNMGCTVEAIELFEASRKKGGAGAVWYAPGKASNCGGVAVSGLEMAQNSQRLVWTREEVDSKLNGIMSSCFNVRLFLVAVYESRADEACAVLDMLRRWDEVLRRELER
jgi:glutamate dehydrogenase (NADP+)